MRIASLFFVSCILTACQRQDESHAQQPERLNASQLFEKKVECGKLLAHIEGALAGPEVQDRNGTTPLNPIVFYSPGLNTCLYIHRFITSGQTPVSPRRANSVEYASVEDLLTGKSIEEHEFDLETPQQQQAAADYVDEVLNRYGPLGTKE